MTLNSEKKIILVVDDATPNIAVLAGILQSEYKIKVANNGERALKIARGDAPPDLILLDVMMPDIDGYEVCKQLKANDLTRGIKIIFVTGMDNEADIEQGHALGAVGYLTKPVDAASVMAKVREVLG